MGNTGIAQAWLDAVVSGGYERVESLLGDDYRLRDLSPHEARDLLNRVQPETIVLDA